MKSYSVWKTVWKAFWTWAKTAGVVGAAGVLAIEWPEDPSAIPIEGWMVFAFTLIPAVWHALENWRKNSGRGGVAGEHRFEWIDILKKVFGASPVFLLALAIGCATADTRMTYSTTDPETGMTETIEFDQNGIVTMGSKQELAEGEFLYDWDHIGGQLSAGGRGVGQEAGNPEDLIIRLLDRFLMMPTPEPAPAPNPPPDFDWAEILEILKAAKPAAPK